MSDNLKNKLQALNERFFQARGITDSRNILVTDELEFFVYCKEMTVAGTEEPNDKLVQIVISDFKNDNTIIYKLAIDLEGESSHKFSPRQVIGVRVSSVSESVVSAEGLKRSDKEIDADSETYLCKVIDKVIQLGKKDSITQPKCAGDVMNAMKGDFSHIPLYAPLEIDQERRRWTWRKAKYEATVGPDFAEAIPESGAFRGESRTLPDWVPRPNESYVDQAGKNIGIAFVNR